MINKIIDGICTALSEEFGEEYEIYTEDVTQGLKEPCFTVFLLNPATTLFPSKRHYRTHLFCVHYFPKGDESRSECNSVTERLMGCLEYIKVGEDLTRGTQMNAETSDGVLSFFVNYDFFVKEEPDELPYMETLTQQQLEKGE